MRVAACGAFGFGLRLGLRRRNCNGFFRNLRNYFFFFLRLFPAFLIFGFLLGLRLLFFFGFLGRPGLLVDAVKVYFSKDLDRAFRFSLFSRNFLSDLFFFNFLNDRLRCFFNFFNHRLFLDLNRFRFRNRCGYRRLNFRLRFFCCRFYRWFLFFLNSRNLKCGCRALDDQVFNLGVPFRNPGFGALFIHRDGFVLNKREAGLHRLIFCSFV